METWKLLLITLLSAVVLGCIIGVLSGKHMLRRARGESKPLLSTKERIIYSICLVAGAACIAAGLYFIPQNAADSGMAGDGMTQGGMMGGDGMADDGAVATDGGVVADDEVATDATVDDGAAAVDNVVVFDGGGDVEAEAGDGVAVARAVG